MSNSSGGSQFPWEKGEASFGNFTRQCLCLVWCFSLLLTPILGTGEFGMCRNLYSASFSYTYREFSTQEKPLWNSREQQFLPAMGCVFLSVSMDRAGRGPEFLLWLPGLSQLVVLPRKCLKKRKHPCTCFQTAPTEHPGWAMFGELVF